MDIGEWLRSLGLQSYEQTFRDNGIDLEILPHLTVEDLTEIGVQAVGHRRKLLDAIGLLPADLAPARPPASVERRQLTLMFVDLVGSTDLSRRLDPEELREVMRAYSNTVAGEIARLEGHVAKFLGDGVQAYFGWPRASEDAAEQAVRAGLAVATAVSSLSATSLATVMQTVASGYGATLLPEVAADAELRDDRVKLLRFVEPQPGRSIGLAWRRTSPRKGDFLALGQMVKHALNAPARPQCIRHERGALRTEI